MNRSDRKERRRIDALLFEHKAKPRRCRIGWHAWYLDAALIRSADRCSRCGKYADSKEGRELRSERHRMDMLPPGSDIAALYIAALNVQPIPTRKWSDVKAERDKRRAERETGS